MGKKTNPYKTKKYNAKENAPEERAELLALYPPLFPFSLFQVLERNEEELFRFSTSRTVGWRKKQGDPKDIRDLVRLAIKYFDVEEREERQRISINTKNKEGMTPLHICFLPSYAISKIKKKIKERRERERFRKRADSCLQVENRLFPFHEIVLFGIWVGVKRNHILQLFLENGAKIDGTDCRQNGVLHYMIKSFPESLSFYKTELSRFWGNVDLLNQNGQSPLHLCYQNSYVEQLLELGANSMGIDKSGNSPLHSLMKETRRTELIVSTMIKNGAEIDYQNQFGETPFHVYLKNENVTYPTVKTLLSLGADPTIQDTLSRTPFELSLSLFLKGGCNWEVVMLIINWILEREEKEREGGEEKKEEENGKEEKKGEEENGEEEKKKEEEESGEKEKKEEKKEEEEKGRSRRGRIIKRSKGLKVQGEEIKWGELFVEGSGYNPFHSLVFADISEHSPEVVVREAQRLLSLGVNPNKQATQPSVSGYSPLHSWASHSNDILRKDVSLLKFFLSECNVNLKCGRSQTPLHILVKRLCRCSADPALSDLYISLFLSSGAKIEGVDENQETPLFSSISCLPVLQILLANKANPNHQNLDFKRTVLHQAILEPYYHYSEHHIFEVVKMLLENNADPNILDCQKNSPLHFSLKNGDGSAMRVGVVKLLLDYEANVDATNLNGETPIFCLLSECLDRKKSMEICKLLVEQFRANLMISNNDGEGLLHACLKNCPRQREDTWWRTRENVIKYLLLHDVDISAISCKSKSSPLVQLIDDIHVMFRGFPPSKAFSIIEILVLGGVMSEKDLAALDRCSKFGYKSWRVKLKELHEIMTENMEFDFMKPARDK